VSTPGAKAGGGREFVFFLAEENRSPRGRENLDRPRPSCQGAQKNFDDFLRWSWEKKRDGEKAFSNQLIRRGNP